MEGIMMKSADRYAVAVRKPDKEIEIKITNCSGPLSNKTLKKLPIVRGVVSFLDSLITGIKTLEYSASFFEDEEEEEKGKKPMTAEEKAAEEKKEKAAMAGTLALSFVIALGIFVLLPYGLSRLLKRFIESELLVVFLEGVLRLVILVAYMGVISLMEDIKRTYMYHGAEHKCINCIETGKPLTVENVQSSTRFHKRCGTSFLIIVALISIVFFMFIRVDESVLSGPVRNLVQLALRLLLVPVIAGVSFEFIRLAGKGDNLFIRIISAPGLWLQRLTTQEPTDDMVEVAIAAVEAVFDWRKYLKDEFDVDCPAEEKTAEVNAPGEADPDGEADSDNTADPDGEVYITSEGENE